MQRSSDSSLPFFTARRSLTLALVGAGALAALRQDVVDSAAASPATDRMTAELLRAAERADICTSANAVGVGLRGEYFAEANLRGPVKLMRIDEVVDFDHSFQSHAASNGQAVGSVRWRGWVKAPLSGTYRFHSDAPGMTILVAREPVAGEGAVAEGKIDLAAGRFYPVEIVVNRVTQSDKRIRLEWTAPHGARYVVPRALLHLPTDNVTASRG